MKEKVPRENSVQIAKGIRSNALKILAVAGIAFGVGKSSLENTASGLTESQIIMIEKTVGIPITELLKENDVEFPMPPRKGEPLFIHFGQMHEDPFDSLETLLSSESIVNSQGTLYRLLPSVAKTSNATCIYSEGLAETAGLEKLRESFSELEKRLSESERLLGTTLEEADRLFELYRYTAQVYNAVSFPSVKEKLIKLQDRLETISKKFDYYAEQPNDLDREKSLKSLLRGRYEIFQLQVQLQIQLQNLSALLGNNMFVSLGADKLLFAERKIRELCPGEQEETNADALARLSDYKRIRETVIENASASNPRETLAKGEAGRQLQLLDELSTARERYEQAAFTLREEALLANIAADDQKNVREGKTPGNVMVIFGSGHDWTEELKAQNEKRGVVRRGLLKITPKQ